VADIEELRALLDPVRESGRGVVALLPGGVLHNKDVFSLQQHCGRPVTWTALLTVKNYPYHLKVIEEHDAARDRGIEVWPQVSCRKLVFQMNLAEPFTLNARPSFAGIMGHSPEDRLAAYRDPAWRASAWEELSGAAGGLPFNFQAVSVAESPNHPELAERQVFDLAAERGCTALDVMLDISLEDGLKTRFWSVVANDDEEGIAWLLPRDNVLLGLADSGAHVSQLCDACFATDLLGNWVRDRGVMSLERAVHKLTAEPAAVYGFSDRGSIEVGKAADICVFDPATISPGPLRRVYDFPADGERLTADAPVGVAHVLVNGVAIRQDGSPVAEGLDVRPGRVLRA
jgi:N-acyl-D-aspartate/D-glutamate deacylase